MSDIEETKAKLAKLIKERPELELVQRRIDKQLEGKDFNESMSILFKMISTNAKDMQKALGNLKEVLGRIDGEA